MMTLPKCFLLSHSSFFHYFSSKPSSNKNPQSSQSLWLLKRNPMRGQNFPEFPEFSTASPS